MILHHLIFTLGSDAAMAEKATAMATMAYLELHTMPGGASTSRFGSKPGTITSNFYSHSVVQN